MIWIITIFLSLAMLSLVGVQAYWIRHTIDAEERQLNLVMQRVLFDMSEELVQNETVMHILEELQPPLLHGRRSQSVWNYQIDARSSYGTMAPPDSSQKNHAMRYSPPHESLMNPRTRLIDDSILLVLGQDALDTILVSAMDPEQIRRDLYRRLAENSRLVDRIARNMMEEKRSINEKISQAHIENLLKSKLAQNGISMPFEYAVYEEGHAPIFRSSSFNEFEDCSYHRTSIFPANVFRARTMISVYFPNDRQHIFRSMGLIGWTSALITLFVITVFSLAIYIIFKQKRLSEMKNDFVSNMTHELKTPISTISLASQMLSDRSIPNAQKNLGQISRIIETESKQLSLQVERVLQMAVFDQGELKLKLETLDLNDILETIAQNFFLQIDRKGGHFEFLPEADNAIIKGDYVHITNVISNLLENAIKYSGELPEIGLKTRNVDGKLVIEVSDNGIGIGKENQKRIFNKFYRVPTGNVHNVKGFGLGLSYVRLILEEHGGDIQVKSELQKGTQFFIHLPLLEQEPNR